MAAVLAEGVTVIHGAAREPEIEELCLFLIGMGARIHGVGSSNLVIEGVAGLHDSIFTVTGDRIVAGTLSSCGHGRRGKCDSDGNPAGSHGSSLRCAEEMGAEVRRYDDRISADHGGPSVGVSCSDQPVSRPSNGFTVSDDGGDVRR